MPFPINRWYTWSWLYYGDQQGVDPLAVWYRHENMDNDSMREWIAEDIQKERIQQQKEQSLPIKQDLVLSPEDDQRIKELMIKKIEVSQDDFPIKKLAAKYQRRIRNSINETRKQYNEPEITYAQINPIDPSYDKTYAQMIVDQYNANIDATIQSLYTAKKYAYELEKIQTYTKEQLQDKMRTIPQEVQSEIIQSLQLDPHTIATHQKETAQKIVATFNAHYPKNSI